MINPVTPVGRSLTFGKIIEPDKDFYTERQRKLANSFKELSKLTNPEDANGRSYVDFIKDELDMDFNIKAIRKNNSIELYSMRSDGTKELEAVYKKGTKPRESFFKSFNGLLAEEKRDFRDELITVLTYAFVAVSVAIMSLKGNVNTTKLDQLVKTEVTHLKTDSIKASPSLLFKNLAK